MFNQIGVTRLHVTVPIATRDEMPNGENTVLVLALASLTIEPRDPSAEVAMNPETIKARISKELVIDGEYQVEEFLSNICRDYRAKRAYFSLLFGYVYNNVTYPISKYWTFAHNRIKKHVTQIAVVDEHKKYTVEVQFNTDDFIWHEDVIDTIRELIDNHEGTHQDLAREIVEYVSSDLPGTCWYEVTVINVKDNFIARSERKI